MHKKGFYEKFIKRPMDFILSLIALIVLSPVLLIVAVLVRIKLGSPVLFKQPRPGKNEKIFNLYKFRSMTSQKDSKGNLLPDEIRLTKLGTVLRSLSLDELPSLLNILKGDPNFKGPVSDYILSGTISDEISQHITSNEGKINIINFLEDIKQNKDLIVLFTLN